MSEYFHGSELRELASIRPRKKLAERSTVSEGLQRETQKVLSDFQLMHAHAITYV